MPEETRPASWKHAPQNHTGRLEACDTNSYLQAGSMRYNALNLHLIQILRFAAKVCLWATNRATCTPGPRPNRNCSLKSKYSPPKSMATPQFDCGHFSVRKQKPICGTYRIGEVRRACWRPMRARTPALPGGPWNGRNISRGLAFAGNTPTTPQFSFRQKAQLLQSSVTAAMINRGQSCGQMPRRPYACRYTS